MPFESDEIVVIQINDSSDKTITGTFIFDRSRGGILVLPYGTTFPTGSVTAGEVFFNTTTNTLYRRTDDNTTWFAITGGGSVADVSASYLVVGLTSSLVNERQLTAGPGITFTDGGPNGFFAVSSSLSAGNLILIDSGSGGAINVAVSSSVITSASHETLRQLIHFIDEGPTAGGTFFYKKMLPLGAIFPQTASWFADAGFTQKVVEQRVAWQGPVISQSIWQIFDITGVVPLATVTDTTTYVSGIFETVTTRSIS